MVKRIKDTGISFVYVCYACVKCSYIYIPFTSIVAFALGAMANV